LAHSLKGTNSRLRLSGKDVDLWKFSHQCVCNRPLIPPGSLTDLHEDKSGKKFAPKAPSRRPAAAPSTQSSARASVERQALSQTPQPSINKSSLGEPPAPPASAAANAHPLSNSEVSSDVSVSREATLREATTLIPVPSQRTHETRSVHVQVQSQDHRQPRAEQAPTQKPRADLHQSREVEQSPKDNTQNDDVRADEGFVVRRSGRSGGLGVTNQGAAPDTNSLIAPHTRIQSQRQEENIRAEPTAKRRRIDSDSHPRPPTKKGGVGSESSNPIPTTETSDHATQDAEAESPPFQPVGTAKKRKSAKAKGKQRLGDATDATGRSKKGRGGGRPGRRREPTPEDAETVKITPSLVKMADLCKDLRTGKKSKRETELQGMDAKELARKEEERKLLREGGQLPTPAPADDVPDRLAESDAQAAQHGHLVPQTRIRNGIIEVDPDSLVLDRHAHAAQTAVEVEIREENTLTRRITSATWMKRERIESWNEEFTDRFYQGLRMFGTDFEMISKLFPGRTRRSIKLKFCKEEKLDKDKIKETLLGPREPVDMAKFSEMTNTEYKDPKEFERELQEDRRNLEEQQAREREAHDELVRQKGVEVAAESAAAGGGSSAKENEAQGDESGAVPPTKGKRGRKATGKTKPGRAKKVVGGAVEVLGAIE